MISVDFLGDLLEVLKKILANESLSLASALQCAITAFHVLKVRYYVVCVSASVMCVLCVCVEM